MLANYISCSTLMLPHTCQFLYFAPRSLRYWVGEKVSEQEASEANFSAPVANNQA
jgi:hypothetical protein